MTLSLYRRAAYAPSTTPTGTLASLVASTSAGSTGGSNVTTPAITTTGASLLIVALSSHGGTTITDSKSNTWTALGTAGSNPGVQLFYNSNPIVGTGHTFTTNLFLSYPSLAVAAFSGTIASSTPDINVSAAAAQPGSGTPIYFYEMIVTALAIGAATPAVNQGFTILQTVATVAGECAGISLAWLTEAGKASLDPTWSGGSPNGTTMASFRTQ